MQYELAMSRSKVWPTVQAHLQRATPGQSSKSLTETQEARQVWQASEFAATQTGSHFNHRSEDGGECSKCFPGGTK